VLVERIVEQRYAAQRQQHNGVGRYATAPGHNGMSKFMHYDRAEYDGEECYGACSIPFCRLGIHEEKQHQECHMDPNFYAENPARRH
jgi:hypothetical protein